ncbi:hypothetical protein H4J51_09430 [Colwellia sp. MB02u-18]|uniref:pectate lyase family protein n=1 Tax=unclassified Colwellia TaxID=196834 RepID=UPI0015F6B3E5|nr:MULTISPECIES: hypothetical protein [unclassified Colwellia]MBA6225371.1 hypothetical protein [Colwellia sp. MB3u-45]MBA6267179.1 hypothetical protein [Colwellia sp. MB3u-43]MBA6322791.1 hypothetical protein [Colwellia sp. MB02u-19]MBA6324801.1 hypothetical protein [Colwellia sp. MB02u-18]MBA6331008.1 hypothetical protein [Colwellia sp. MB02u-12]
MFYNFFSNTSLANVKYLFACWLSIVSVGGALSLSVAVKAYDTLPTLAFSDAKGFGKYSQGGINGKLYIVNSLADDLVNPAIGTLRYAIKQKHPRTVVFSVSGVIKLAGPLKISGDYLTIAGQSSPGGITLAGAPITVSGAKHIVIRYLRFRLGTFGYADDALSVRNSEYVIIDHCSLSWSVDETGSFYNNRNFTLQNSIIANSLNDSIHPKGKHGYGGIWGGANASFIHNIVANHASRTPRINGYRLKPHYPQADEFVEIIDNIFFNWGHNNVYGSENGRFNLMNNFYKPGLVSKITQIADIWYSPLIQNNQAYIADNFYENNANLSKENWRGVNYRKQEKAKRTPSKKTSPWLSATILTPFDTNKHIYLPILPAKEIFNMAIENNEIGASKNAHGHFVDSVDRIIYLQLQGKSKSKALINHENEDMTSWLSYEEQFTKFPVLVDENHDGVDDQWAKQWFLKHKESSLTNTDNNLLNDYLDSLTE